MPVFWFGLSALREPFSAWRAVSVFVVLHLLAYPASNGYNSYYDRDEGSIGGLRQPPKVSRELLHLVWLFDALAVVGAWLLSPVFAVLVAGYLLVSKAYSYEGIRLKKYPLLSTAVVVVFQGAYTFLMTQVGVAATSSQLLAPDNLLLALVSSLFLCGSYPLTQVYQHAEDARRGDRTLSLRLGIRGTFVFAGTSPGRRRGPAGLRLFAPSRSHAPAAVSGGYRAGGVAVRTLGLGRVAARSRRRLRPHHAHEPSVVGVPEPGLRPDAALVRSGRRRLWGSCRRYVDS